MGRRPETDASDPTRGGPWADAALPAFPEPATLRAPGMLLIGAAGRDAGKTELACAVLRQTAPEREVVAAKVTTIHDTAGACPRGGRGCGACEDMDGPFEIQAEDGAESGKDTARMLAAGARQVFWVRARREALELAAAALLDRIGAGTACVCESNSLRLAVEPGLFAVARREGSPEVKETAARVLPWADLHVSSDGRGFRPSPEELRLADGPRWSSRQAATAIVLAGGQSRRMGRDKALLPVAGRPMIERIVEMLRPFFEEILVSSAEPDRYSFLGERIVVDSEPGQGPLRGVASALACSSHDTNLVVACDVPDPPLWLALRLLRAARGAGGAVPLRAGGGWEPLFAVYDRKGLSLMEAALARGERRIARLFSALGMRSVLLPEGTRVEDLDTPEDYAAR